MENKAKLSVSLLGVIAISGCTTFYFIYKTQNEFAISLANAMSVLFCFVFGFGSAIIGYLASTGRIAFDQGFGHPKPEWGRFRQALNNPKYYSKVLEIISLSAPFLIGIGVASDAYEASRHLTSKSNTRRRRRTQQSCADY